jgi:hypothetical protein
MCVYEAIALNYEELQSYNIDKLKLEAMSLTRD